MKKKYTNEICKNIKRIIANKVKRTSSKEDYTTSEKRRGRSSDCSWRRAREDIKCRNKRSSLK